jgi:hypothetical protein
MPRRYQLFWILCALCLLLPTVGAAQIDTLDQHHGDFSIGAGTNPICGQSFEAFSDHIGSVTLLGAGFPGNFFLLVTAARVDALAPGGVSPDFNDIRYRSSLIELSNIAPDFREISLDVDADMIIGEKIFIVADMFSEGASGRVGFEAANALTDDAIPSGDLLWMIKENVPQNATELTDLNVDGAFTGLFSDIAIRIAVPEPAELQMQMVALLAVFVLVATRQRRRLRRIF